MIAVSILNNIVSFYYNFVRICFFFLPNHAFSDFNHYIDVVFVIGL